MVIMTDDPEGCADALNAETIVVPKRWPRKPMTITTVPVPPVAAWPDTAQLVRLQGLPRHEPLTTAQLRARGVRLHELSLGGSP
jgi:hypothetical protein